MATRPQSPHPHEHALREAEGLRRMIEAISSELELQPLLTRIVSHACELMDADDGTIGLYDPVRKVIRTEAVYNMPEREVGAETGPGVGLAGAVIASGQPIVLVRYDELPEITLPELAANSVIGMPIVSRGELVGFFGIGAHPPRRFKEGDLHTLQLFGRHAAIAIDNAMRYQRERARSERMSLIAQVSRLVSLQMEPTDLVATAAQVIREQLGYPQLVIRLLKRDPANRARAGLGGETSTAEQTSVPIALGHEMFGVIDIDSRVVDDEDMSCIQVIADHLAVAIKNAGLFEESREAAVMRERARLARDLHDSVTQVLSSISMISQSLVSAWRRDEREGERRTHRLEELSRLAFSEMRALLRELRPPEHAAGANVVDLGSKEEVASYGLRRALQRLLGVMAPEFPGATLDFASYRTQALASEETLYRICQEAIANVLRHSGATVLTIRAQVLPTGTVRVEIVDNGCGFDVTAAPVDRAQGGFGTHTMCERAEALGGSATIDSTPGQGTRIVIELPRDDR